MTSLLESCLFKRRFKFNRISSIKNGKRFWFHLKYKLKNKNKKETQLKKTKAINSGGFVESYW